MRRIITLNDLLIEELGDLLNVENQLMKALTNMVEASQSLALKAILQDHLEDTRFQAERLRNIFGNIGQNPPKTTCWTIKEFIGECEDVIHKADKGPARDRGIISVAQRIEQYEITWYQKAWEHSADLGHTRIMELLEKTLLEERSMNLHLNEIAQGMINMQTLDPVNNPQHLEGSQDQALKPKKKGFYILERWFYKESVRKNNNNVEISRFISEGNPNFYVNNKKSTVG